MMWLGVLWNIVANKEFSVFFCADTTPQNKLACVIVWKDG